MSVLRGRTGFRPGHLTAWPPRAGLSHTPLLREGACG